MCERAAWGGNLDVLAFVREHGCLWDEQNVTSRVQTPLSAVTSSC